MPLQETSGAASYDAYGGGVAVAPVYIEDVMSTYLYTGNGSTQTITNGIDLAGKGGLVWVKIRSGFNSPLSHALFDTSRGVLNRLASNLTDAQASTANSLTAFNSTGFTVGSSVTVNGGGAGDSYSSWTFRKAPKFFDVVTWSGDGVVDRMISHTLGSTPGCIMVKCTSTGGTNWVVWHRGLSGSTYSMYLDLTDAQANNGWIKGQTSTTFTVNDKGNELVNASGRTYVAYLFAHDAGGFGLSGTDNVISCGSFTTDGSGNATVNLGYEPQWVMWKAASTTGGWNMLDNMRGFTVGGADALLNANSSSAETSIDLGSPTATGFTAAVAGTNANYIYIAIRRGPMKVPTSGTSVFSPIVYAGNSSTQSLTGFGFPPDMSMLKSRNQGYPANVYDKLRGAPQQLVTPYNSEELTQANSVTSFDQNGISLGAYSQTNTSAQMSGWNFRRAPGFFDEVCYTGTGVARTVNHNLGVAPELMIVKKRNAVEDWGVYTATTGNTGSLRLNTTGSFIVQSVVWNNTSPTSTVFTVGTNSMVNANADTYVAYLFASAPGVSKCGSYTGTGTTQQINCGFTGGARFVLIKRTDSTGDWYVWDSARGIVAGNDPYLLLNSTAAEVTNTDFVDTAATGFEISSTAPAAINASGGTFIFLAIA